MAVGKTTEGAGVWRTIRHAKLCRLNSLEISHERSFDTPTLSNALIKSLRWQLGKTAQVGLARSAR